MENTTEKKQRRLVILALGESDAIKLEAFLSIHASTSDERLQKIKNRILKALTKMDSEGKEALATMRQDEGLVQEEQ